MDVGLTLRTALLASALAALLAPAATFAAKDDLLLVSVPTLPAAGAANGDSDSASVSADGRYVAFTSNANNLSAIDTSTTFSVYVRDTVTNTTTLASRQSASLGGANADGSSSRPSISADGRYVAFLSFAGNLSTVDTNAAADVYVRDTVAETTTLVSRQSPVDGGAVADSGASQPAISADGRHVAFISSSDNLSTSDDDTVGNIYVRDLDTDTTTLVSRRSAADGAAGANGFSSSPSISADGRHVAFHSAADNLVPKDLNGVVDVFVRDTVAFTTTLVSRTDGGDPASGGDSSDASISADGQRIAFASYADDLSDKDDDGVRNVYVRNLTKNGTTFLSRAAVSGAGGDDDSTAPSISADGTRVAFVSQADNLSSEDNDAAFTNIFVRSLDDETTTLVSRQAGAGGAGANGASDLPSISGDGRHVAFHSGATNLSAVDAAGVTDVFLRDVLGDPVVTPTPTPVTPVPDAVPAPAPLPAAPAPGPGPVPLVLPSGPVTPPASKNPAKLEVERAGINRSRRRLDVLAPITGRASGTVRARFQAAGRTATFSTKIDASARRVKIARSVSKGQARLGTGILTLEYGGDADTQPQTVRLRAASGKANLRAGRPTITGDRLTAKGTISKRAKGVVRVQVLFETAAGTTETLEFNAPIENGRYTLDEQLSPEVVAAIAARRGVVHSYTLFTGYLGARMRGEMRSYEVLGAP